MSSFPNEYDTFLARTNAQHADDPNGDWVMAEDINELQDAILSLQATLGLSPSGMYDTIASRLAAGASESGLAVPSILIYDGQLRELNGSNNVDEAAEALAPFAFVVLGEGRERDGHNEHIFASSVIARLKDRSSTQVIGTVDIGVNTENFTMDEISTRIAQWEAMGVDGIRLRAIDYSYNTPRERQNDALDRVHDRDLFAVIDADDPDDLLSDRVHDTYNPDWSAPHIATNDMFLVRTFAVDSGSSDLYESAEELDTRMQKLLGYRRSLGIRLAGLPLIRSDETDEQAQVYFEYAQAMAILYSLDAFHPVLESYSRGVNKVPTYDTIPILGEWYTETPNISTDGDAWTRPTAFGAVTVNPVAHTYDYDGIRMPFDFLHVPNEAILGGMIAEGVIEDRHIGEYNGQRLIQYINAAESGLIDIDRITEFDYQDLDGSVPVDALNANVIKAVNASIEEAVIGQAFIDDLDAEKITAGTIDAERISGSVMSAIEFYAGSAVIDQAKISDLDAEKITAGDIHADRIQSTVVDAINLSAQQAEIDYLNANNIRAGDIAADRMRANIVNAVNLYASSISAGEALIDTAVIDELSSDHIEAAVIDAINANIDIAKIDEAVIQDLNAKKIVAGDIDAERIQSNVVGAINNYATNLDADSARITNAAIGSLTADHIKAEVIQAINANISDAVINAAQIGELDADNIKAHVIEAINANIESAQIDAAQIGDLDAEQITTGDITADRMKVSVIDAINGAFSELTIDNAKIGTLDADNMSANVVEAVNLDASEATIGAAKVGEMEVENMQAAVIQAINADIDTATIDAAQVGTLTSDHIQASVIEAINANLDQATIDAAIIGQLSAEQIEAVVIEAVNISSQSATINAAKIGNLNAEQIQAAVIEAININATTASIDSAKIGELDADNIASNSILARHVKADELNADHIQSRSITADLLMSEVIEARHMQAETIQTQHISTYGLDAEILKSGYISSDRIEVGSLDASVLKAQSIISSNIAAQTIQSSHIQTGGITADNLQAGSINASHITTQGLDAEIVSVYNGRTGETLIGSGYVRVNGLDHGVVQSDNLASNGMFMTASSMFGYKRDNPAGEVIIGSDSDVSGGHEIWKYDLDTGEHVASINVPGKKPAFLAIDYQQKYAYVTVQGDDTMKQVDLEFDTVTEEERPMGKAPTRVKFTGDLLGDMKHVFAVNTDKTDAEVPDSFYVLDVPPHSDFEQFYVHHQIPTGNTPYDFVMSERDKKVYITMHDQGHIMVLDVGAFPTYQWRVSEYIPIAPYGTDNYHGGLESGYGLGTAVGGDASAEYNKDDGHGGHGGGHAHGGYSVSDGTMIEYKPRGIAIDGNENLLMVAETQQQELVIVNRIEEDRFDWPTHPDYQQQEWIDKIEEVRQVFEPYDMNPEKAVADGYTTMSSYVPYMGYHFSNPAGYTNDMPNTIVYIFDTDINEYRAIGAEWMVNDPSTPSPIPGKDWDMSEPSRAEYADGLMLMVGSEADAPATHPETGSDFVRFHEAVYGIHLYYEFPNPLGLFEEFNPLCAPYNETNPEMPPGFESYVDPDMTDSDYKDYQSPANDDMVHDHGSMGSMSTSSASFSAMAGGHHDHGGTEEDEETVGPDTEGQGLVYKYVRHRVPINAAPEFITRGGGKVWVSLYGGTEVAVMNEYDLYRTDADIERSGWEAYVRHIEVGAKPLDLVADDERGRLYVTVQGDSQVTTIDMGTEEVLSNWQAGANTMGMDITPDGKYLYVANNGGVGELSFVYPEGDYIGDAFIGLEGDVQYQGADKWVPDRSDWTYNPDGTIRSSATVEFRINEPFLNEGGYAKLSTNGDQGQYALIEQDLYNVTNYSNGNNTGTETGERLRGTEDRRTWFPNNPWLEEPPVSNVVIAHMDGQDKITRTPSEDDYMVHYDGGPRIEFLEDIVGEEEWVEADYTFRADVWFNYHNGSLMAALENSSSRNFNANFQIDEFVPKFVTYDNQQVEPFEYTPIEHAGTNADYDGLIYSGMTNRAYNLDKDQITLTDTPVNGELGVIFDNDPSSSYYVELPEGEQSITVDLGAIYMVNQIKLWHFWQDGRTYHDNVTEVSEDGVTWETVFDSNVDGEYVESEDGHTIHWLAHPDRMLMDTYLKAKQVRYVRDTVNGNTTNANAHWAEIQVFGDWEVERDYVYPVGSSHEGEPIATNGKELVTTTVPEATITVNLEIDYTTWWYMTYLVGPEFGMMDIEMPTAMGGSHQLPMGNPYINKVAHKHIMVFKPGYHTAILKQRQGKVSLDRLRFEDYQYYGRSSLQIPKTEGVNFNRYKIVPEQARNYIGSGNQSTQGAYDEPRVNPDTKQRDYSVPIMYRIRVRANMSPEGVTEERGTAYITSFIFEQGKLSSHWRPSASADKTPGDRIESWDANQPHGTGIQWYHLANGAIRGRKILPGALMDYHVSAYARINEVKLDLNHPTHRHGHMMPHADGREYFHDNKADLDLVMGWGDSGTSHKIARADHTHSTFDGAPTFTNGLHLGGDLTASDGVTINGMRMSDMQDHIGAGGNAHREVSTDTAGFMSASDKTKLDGIRNNATRVEKTGNGVVTINGTSTTIYEHPTGDGNKHVPATGSSNEHKVLTAGASAGSFSWESVRWQDIAEKPSVAIQGHTHTVADISDIGQHYYTKSQVDAQIGDGDFGDVFTDSANTLTQRNTFSNTGTAIRIQPSASIADGTSMFQINNAAGNSLVSIRKESNATDGDYARFVVNGDFEVTGSTIQKQTQSIEGDMNISGNLNTDGDTILGDSLDDQTTVSGDLRVEGALRQIGQLSEVMRVPLFGNAGHVQFETDELEPRNVIRSYYTVSPTRSAVPAPAEGATRWYKLLVTYGTQGENSDGMILLTDNSQETIFTEQTLPQVYGGADVTRSWLSDAFTVDTTSHTYIRAYSQGGGTIHISNVQLIAYDEYEGGGS